MVKYRFKCDCGKMYDSAETSMACPSCKKENSTEGNGVIQIHRVSNYSGAFNAMNIFIDEQPFGTLADGLSVKFVVPYGTHKYRATLFTVKKSDQPEVTLSAESPEAYIKTEVDFFGTKIHAKTSEKEKMPK